MGALLVLFWGIVLLVIVVVIHEAGHTIAAKAFGVRVTEFMVGMPGPSIGFVHKGTRYGVTAIPLGGYSRICGMDSENIPELMPEALAYVWRNGSADAEHLALALGISEDDADALLERLSEWGSVTTPSGRPIGEYYLAPAADGFEKGQPRPVDDPDALLEEQRKGTYQGISIPKRLAILFAGPLANIISAIIVVVLLLSLHGVYEASTTIAGPVEGTPAAAAGLKQGDTIVSVDGAGIKTWDDLSTALSSHKIGDSVEVGYNRDGQEHSKRIKLYDNEGSPALGIYAGRELVRMSIPDAFSYSGDYIYLVITSIAKLFNPSTMQQTLDQSVSVVGIAYMAKEAADQGVISLLSIGIAISVSLGFMNLIPIPPFDGGKIVIELVQGISRRRVPSKVNFYLSMAGIAMMMVLFVYLTYQDVTRFVLGS